MDYKTGTLIEFRNRPWVVQQSGEDELMIIKPLGGTDAETIGLYLPLYGDELQIHSYNFRRPTADDIGKNSYKASAKVLYNACRLSFRDIAGPFQCLGKLSFEPRPYQMVPLILALKQEKIRLLISDDVGIGKTLESLLIAKELLDRHEINRFTFASSGKMKSRTSLAWMQRLSVLLPSAVWRKNYVQTRMCSVISPTRLFPLIM